MLKKLALWLARRVPAPLKHWVHENRFADRFSRKLFARLVSGRGEALPVMDGPMRGLLLAPSEHVSHAHLSGTYEADTIRAIARALPPAGVCYDLGASIGYVSLLMARHARHVYAFEPAPHAAAEIRRHAAANGFTNITVVPHPVSDSRRTVRFAVTDVAYGSAINDTETRWPVLELETITLDEFLPDHPFPDFIKIDVEGEEGRVLAGARTILAQRKTIICCEVHNNRAAEEVFQILTSYGYRIVLPDGAPYDPRLPATPGELHIMAYPQ